MINKIEMDHSHCQHNAQTIESGFDSFDKELLQQLAVLEDESDTVATSAVARQRPGPTETKLRQSLQKQRSL